MCRPRAQAAKCGELERIARSTQGLFITPPGAALPFGCMDCALKEAGVDGEFQVRARQASRREGDLQVCAQQE